MQLQVGAYSFDANSLRVASSSSVLMEGGVPYGYKVRLMVSGELLADGETALTAAQGAMQNGIGLGLYDAVLYRSDGGLSATLLRNSNSLTGVVLVDGPNFPGTRGSEYVTMREFNFTLEASYKYPVISNTISFRESLSFSGGGPLFAMKRSISGRPQRQKVYAHTEFVVVQAGEAVGLEDWPRAPAQLFPNFLKMAPVLVDHSPEPTAAGYWKYKKTWSYTFESDREMVGSPNLWTS